MRVVGRDGGMLVPSRRNSRAAASIVTAPATTSSVPVATRNHQSMLSERKGTNRSAANPSSRKRTPALFGPAFMLVLQPAPSDEHRLLCEDPCHRALP